MKLAIVRHWRAAKQAGRIGLVLAGFALCPAMVLTQEKTEVPLEREQILLEQNVTGLEEKENPLPPNVARKRQRAFAGLAAVGGIAILGVAIIAATMMWAKRLRRLARGSGPVQKTIGNDFWFLKASKPVAKPPASGEKTDRTP